MKTDSETLTLIKTVSGGNDFLHLDRWDLFRAGDGLTALVRAVCRRHDGLGADGLVLRGPVRNGGCDFRVFNRDGREAELSGNGMAGCAAVLFQSAPRLGRITLRTAVGPREVICEQRTGARFFMRVEIGRPDFFHSVHFPFLRPRRLQYSFAGVEFVPVSMGNPHAVCLLSPQTPDSAVSAMGKQLMADRRFPEGVNVELVRPGKAGHWQVVFIERGVGPTGSSSTGCAAVHAVLNRLGQADQASVILTPRGDQVRVQGDERGVTVENISRIVYKGEYELAGETD